MTKIEVYKAELAKLDRLEKLQETLSDSRCDKQGFVVSTCTSHYGWYGNSSVSRFGTEEENAIKDQASREYKYLLGKAIERQKKIVSEKKTEAREEAEAVLAETN